MRSGCTWRMWAPAIALLASMPLFASAAPIAGGSGHGLYFTSQRADVASFPLLGLNGSDSFTTEFWMRKADHHVITVPFSYGVWDSQQTPPFVNVQELSLFLVEEYGVVKIYVGELQFDCPNANCTFLPDWQWHHFAMSVDSRPGAGELRFYRDGNLLFDSSKLSPPQLVSMPLRGPGVVVLGQEMDDWMGGFDQEQNLDGVMDDLRFWNHARTADQIRGALHRRLEASQEPGLIALLHFDEDLGSDVAVDSSGNGNNAELGYLQDFRRVASYSTGRGQVPAQKPRRVRSSAPLYGGAVEARVAPGGQVLLELPGWSDSAGPAELVVSIQTLPNAGTLHVVDGGRTVDDAAQLPALEVGAEILAPSNGNADQHRMVWYVPGPGFRAAGSDTFMYTVTDPSGASDSASVVVRPISVSETPAPVSREADEGGQVVLTLGQIGADGAEVKVVITSLPVVGTLYDVKFTSIAPAYPMELEATFNKYRSVKLLDRTAPITAEMLPYDVPDRSGTIVYIPPPDSTSKITTDGFLFRHRYGEALSGPGQSLETPDSNVSLRIRPVNDGPKMAGESIRGVAMQSLIPVPLAATDYDGSFEGSQIEYKVLSAPRLGRLLHTLPMEGAGTGLQPVDIESTPFSLAQWAAKLPPYDPAWGTSFSSQLGNGCSAGCCSNQATCNEADCIAAGDNWPCLLGTDGLATNILGPASGAIDPASSWIMQLNSPAFIVVEFDVAMYISEVTIDQIELGAEDAMAITSLSVSSDYKGNATDWNVIWRNGAGGSKDVGRFMCVTTAFGRFLRIDLYVGAQSPFLAGVRVVGTMVPPPKTIMSKEAFYQSAEGFHGASMSCEGCGIASLPFDSFELTASDCQTDGEPSTFSVEVAAPLGAGMASTVPELQRVANYTIGAQNTTISVDLELVESVFQQRYGFDAVNNCTDRMHAVAVLASEPEDAFFAQMNGTEIVIDGAPITSLQGSFAELQIIHGDSRAFSSANLEFWSTFCGITVRYIMEVSAVCDPSVTDPRICARSSSDCPSDLEFDPEEKICVPFEGYGGNSTVVPFVAGSLVAVILVLTMTALYLVRNNRKLHDHLSRFIDQTQQGLDLESPITKAVELLGKLKRNVKSRSAKAEIEGVLVAILTASDVTRPDLLTATGEMDEVLAKYLIDTLENKSQYNSMALKSMMSMEKPENSSRGSSSRGGSYAHDWEETFEKLKEHVRGAGVDPMFDSLTFHARANDAAMQVVVLSALREWGVLDQLRLPEGAVHRYINAVQAGYNNNPYHGPAHGVDVTVRMIYILQTTGIVKVLRERGSDGALMLLGAVIATAIHDYEHPGTNNDYVVKMQLPAAQQFNDQSVIENNSLYLALKLMEDPASDCCIVKHMSRSMKLRLRKHIINMVLSTDMSRHFEIQTVFQTKVLTRPRVRKSTSSRSLVSHSAGSRAQLDLLEPDNTASEGVSFEDLGQEEQHSCLLMAIKVADIGHCALPMHLHLPWLHKLEEEFFLQGDMERQMGLTISPIMDRDAVSVREPKSQIGFLSVIVIPLYENFCKAFPQCKALEKMARQNKGVWEAQCSGLYDLGGGKPALPPLPGGRASRTSDTESLRGVTTE